MSKYYTPKLSEFSILDFDFEYKNNRVDLEGNSYSTNWKRKNFNSIEKWCSWDVYSIQRMIDAKNIRVKYLDQQDIEELCFIKEDDGDYYFKGSDYRIDLPQYEYDDYIRLSIEKYGNEGQSLVHIGATGQVLFDGIIKNKSELKRILVMLNIISVWYLDKNKNDE
jgi:hypothetical protein